MPSAVTLLCPYCKTVIQTGDDMVRCGGCHMPHHRDCWVENRGCTTFGCQGTIEQAEDPAAPPQPYAPPAGQPYQSYTPQQYAPRPVAPQPYAPPAYPDAARFCPNCGNRQGAEDQFCTQCGAPLTPAPAAGDEAEAYLIGKNAGSYAAKFRTLRARQGKGGWNWAAFLFAPFWCVYRKLYGWGFGFLLCFGILALTHWFFALLQFVSSVLIGVYGDYLYMKRVETLRALAEAEPPALRPYFYQKYGGTGNGALALAIILNYVIYMIAYIASHT